MALGYGHGNARGTAFGHEHGPWSTAAAKAMAEATPVAMLVAMTMGHGP